MDTQKGFHKGIAAQRELSAREFEKQGSGSFTGYEIAALIRQMPGPQKEDEEKSEQAVRIPA